jgi:hypothetical protein
MRHTPKPRPQAVESLVFVYAADSGPLHAVLDSARKLLSLKGCTLCSLTHGLMGESSQWRSCKEALGVPVEYVHRDEVAGAVAEVVAGRLPSVVARSARGLTLLLDPAAIERCHGSVADLKARIQVHAALHGLVLPD